MNRIIIVGGGLAGSLAALALAERRPDVELLLIEQGQTFGGNHTWSYFDSDIPQANRWVLEGIPAIRWPAHEVRFPKRTRTIDVGYNSIRSADLDHAVRAGLRADQYRLGAGVQSLQPTSVTIDGASLPARVVIDARGPSATAGLELGWQKFLGRYYRFQRPHGVKLPMIMDATVAQIDGYRFIYQLPISATDMLIEDTYYSLDPAIDGDALRDRLDHFATMTGAGPAIIFEEESGLLPVVVGGQVGALWSSSSLPLLGLRGGFFHPTTSYSLPDAVANAVHLTEQGDLTSGAVYALLRNRAEYLWRERAFFRLLNRMLFKAAEPDQAYRVLEHFYRLPAPLISRFYSADLSGLDKLRIMSGKPPVPVGKALWAMMRSAA